MSEEKIGINVMVLSGTSWEITPITKEIWKNLSFDSRIKQYFMRFSPNMDEFQLKGYLRDRGYISSQFDAYNDSQLFFAKSFGESFIKLATSNLETGRTLTELEATEESILIIMAAIERRSYNDWSSMRCLYGCPMAKSVEDEISEAERYTTQDSIITTKKLDNYGGK